MTLPLSPTHPVPILPYKEVVAALQEDGGSIEVIHEDNYQPIIGVSMDSRDIFLGEMFLALDGERFRGVDFIIPAYTRGVRVFVVEERCLAELKQIPEKLYSHCCFFVVKNALVAYQLLAKYYLSRIGGFRVAITGSAGKTTTKEMLTLGWENEYRVFCSYKNENSQLGVPKNIFSLQRQLIGGEPITVMIFELGMSHPGEIGILASIVKPHLAVITNILYAHIGNFSQREDIVLAKGEVIDHLTGHPNLPDYPKGLLIIPENIFGKQILVDKIKADKLTPLVKVKEVQLSVTTTLHWGRWEKNNGHKNNLNKNESEVSKRLFTSQWNDTSTGEKAVVPGLSIFLGETLSLVLEAIEILGLPRQEVFLRLSEKLNQKPKRPSNKKGHSYQRKYPFFNSSNFSSDSPSIFPLTESRLHLINQVGKSLIIDDTYNANPDSVIQAVNVLIGLLSSAPPEVRLQIILGDMLELGKFSRSLHQTCGMKILEATKKMNLRDQERISFFLLGTEMKACYDSLLFPFKKYYERYSIDDPDILHDLRAGCDVNSVAFFKASHGMNLNRLVHDFLRGGDGG